MIGASRFLRSRSRSEGAVQFSAPTEMANVEERMT